MSAQSQPRLSPEEYLARERAAEFKSEYYDGHIYEVPLSETYYLVTFDLQS